MRLKSLNYRQFEGRPAYWHLEGLLLRDINLLVGRNAAGKTRALSVINSLARLLSGKLKGVGSGNWEATFDDDGTEVNYHLKVEDRGVVCEQFRRGSELLLDRGKGGIGKIRAQELDQDLHFQTPQEELAAVARRDAIQHPFLEPLTNWAKLVRYYRFGEKLGKDILTVLVKSGGSEVDSADENATTPLFQRGLARYGEDFKRAIIADMAGMDYPIKDVQISAPRSTSVPALVAGEPVFLAVQEADLQALTDQAEMSSGMFRALAIIVHVNYAMFSETPSCLIIDDIAEGLDFERSCALIDFLMQKAGESSLQLIMATNDRFVMNRVPVEAWTVLQREGSLCRVYNYANSRDKFDDFKLTGLNNFDFFAMDFVHEGMDDEKSGAVR